MITNIEAENIITEYILHTQFSSSGGCSKCNNKSLRYLYKREKNRSYICVCRKGVYSPTSGTIFSNVRKNHIGLKLRIYLIFLVLKENKSLQKNVPTNVYKSEFYRIQRNIKGFLKLSTLPQWFLDEVVKIPHQGFEEVCESICKIIASNKDTYPSIDFRITEQHKFISKSSSRMKLVDRVKSLIK